jgi:hypothetical protein
METNLFDILVNSKKPFSVIQYFTSLKTNPDEKNKEYQIMYLGKGKVPVIENGKVVMDGKKIVKKTETIIKYQTMTKDAMESFLSNINRFNLIINNSDGKVYEKGDFKKHVINKVKEEYRTIK